MSIQIATRFRPFSYQPGSTCFIPGTFLAVSLYPTKLLFYDYGVQVPKKIDEVDFYGIEGPVASFTVVLDLEKERILVTGFAKNGYFSYRIQAGKLLFSKMPQGVRIIHNGKEFPVEDYTVCKVTPYIFKKERLSFGCHKKQEWEAIRKRATVKEFLSFWYFLSQSFPDEEKREGSSLIGNLEEAIEKKEISSEILKTLFLTGFSGIFLPKEYDTEHRGVLLPVVPKEAPHLVYMLQRSKKLLRKLFFSEEGNSFSFLPLNLPELHAGRFIDICTKDGHMLSFEWVKKTVRRIFFRPKKTLEARIFCKKPLEYARVSYGKKKEKYMLGTPIELIEGQLYLFDNFQK